MARLTTPVGPKTRRQQAGLFHARERRRAADNLTKFAADIASAFDLGTEAAGTALGNPYVMPANARLAISYSVALDAGELLVNVGGKTLATPDLAADEIRRLDYFERARSIEVDSTGDLPAGDVTLYVLDEWNVPQAIATGSFT